MNKKTDRRPDARADPKRVLSGGAVNLAASRHWHQIGLEKRPHLSGPSTWPSGLKTADVQPGHTVHSQTRKLPEIQRRIRRIADKCNRTRRAHLRFVKISSSKGRRKFCFGS